MNDSSKIRRPFHQRLPRLAALGLALVVLGAGLGLAPFLLSGEGGKFEGGDRGENPVVGSLPCVIDPELDLIFGIQGGKGGSFNMPVLGILGPPTVPSLLDAYGEPFGMINNRSGWSILGLQTTVTVTLDRLGAAAGAVGLQHWVPDGYLGGRLRIKSPLGDQNLGISKNLLSHSLAQYAANPNLFGTIELRLSPSPSNSALPVVLVKLHFLPAVVVVEHCL